MPSGVVPYAAAVRGISFVTTAVVLLGVLTGCTSGSEAGSSSVDPNPGSSAPAALTSGPAGSVPTAVTPSAEYPEAVLATGLDAATAAVLADTRSTVEVPNGHTFRITHELPTGDTVGMVVRLFAAPGADPAAPPVTESSQEPDGDHIRMRYSVATGSIPADLRSQVLAGLPDAAPVGGPAGRASVSPLGVAAGDDVVTTAGLRRQTGADEPSVLGVVIDSTVSQSQESYADAWAQRAEASGTVKGIAAANSWEAWKSGAKVHDALVANDVIASALSELAALRRCAQEPTNPLTAKAYAEDPAQRQAVVDDVAAAEADIRESAMVLFTTMLTDTGSSLISGAKWLSFIVNPATNYVKQTLTDLISSRLDAARQRVVPCEQSYRISGTLPSQPEGITLTGTACALDKRFSVRTEGDLIGTLSFRPNSDRSGTWAYQGKVSNAPFKVDGTGAYKVTMENDRQSGRITFEFDLTTRIPAVGNQRGSAPAKLDLTAGPPCSGD